LILPGVEEFHVIVGSLNRLLEVQFFCLICYLFFDRMKGTREGGITENASYYIFMQCSDGKAFEAYPVNEWYNFLPQTKHATLGSEEAEEEFSRSVIHNKLFLYAFQLKLSHLLCICL
jgi:Transcription initiation factor IIF, alpha subunit (TFIIF-alpha)